MIATICQAALFSIISGVLGAHAWRYSSRRIWLALAMGLILIDQLAVGLPLSFPALQPSSEVWNWTGKSLSLIAGLLFAWQLTRRGGFDRRSFGLVLDQRPGTLGLILRVVVPALTVWAVLLWFLFATPTTPSIETHAFQSTLPGLSEELIYRGVLLALWMRAFGEHDADGGFGYAAIASTLMFALVHGLSVQQDGNGLQLALSWTPMALPLFAGGLFAICRLRSGSLLLPILFHNATNEFAVVADWLKH